MNLAHQMAVWSEESYTDPNPLIRVGGTEVFFHQLDDFKWAVVFTGTQKDFGDILTDMRAWPWHYKEIGRAHRGFMQTTLSVYPLIKEILYGKKALELVLGGHSLGGDRAQCLASLLWRDGWCLTSQMTIYTYGAAKVFFDPERALGNIKHYRYVFGDDVVPTVPTLLPYWEHSAMQLSLGPSTGNVLVDHKISNYVKATE